MLLAACGVVTLHTHIHTYKEILEVQADTSAIGRCYLLIELIELEHATWLVLIVLDGPDITCIEEQTQLNHPEQLGAILQVHVKADITTLIEELILIIVVVATRTQGAYAPTAYAVGATAVETFLKGQYVTVAVGDGNTSANVESDALTAVQIVSIGVVGIGLDINRSLRKEDSDDNCLPL